MKLTPTQYTLGFIAGMTAEAAINGYRAGTDMTANLCVICSIAALVISCILDVRDDAK